jgi:hypothetical protein
VHDAHASLDLTSDRVTLAKRDDPAPAGIRKAAPSLVAQWSSPIAGKSTFAVSGRPGMPVMRLPETADLRA